MLVFIWLQVRWLTSVIPSAPTSAFACASRISAPFHQPQAHPFAFASTKSLLVAMAGVDNNSLIGALALVTPSGSTTSSAWVLASPHHKPMAVRSLPCRQRNCALRVEQSWPCPWRVASCAPLWALDCASGINAHCHPLKGLPCLCASICWTRRGPAQSHWHMDRESFNRTTLHLSLVVPALLDLDCHFVVYRCAGGMYSSSLCKCLSRIWIHKPNTEHLNHCIPLTFFVGLCFFLINPAQSMTNWHWPALVHYETNTNAAKETLEKGALRCSFCCIVL